MDVSRHELKNVLEQYRQGQISREDLGQWAFDNLAGDTEFSDSFVDEIMYNLVSLHEIGWVFQRHRPDDSKLDTFYNELNNN